MRKRAEMGHTIHILYSRRLEYIMIYFRITFTLITVLYVVSLLLFLHFVIFGLVGLCRRRTFSKAQRKLRYGIIVSARNEEAVIGNLIRSIRSSDYPQDKLDIFVVAHNCTDRTAAAATAAGARVYVYDNPDECTKGYATRYLFRRIEEDYGTQAYDGFFTLDADNVLDRQFITKMNDAFAATDGRAVITSFRNSKNFGANVISAMYGLYFIQGCRMESRGRTLLGCSTRVQGTGYLIPAAVVKDGWSYVTLTEDWELTADVVLDGIPILYCDEAMTYDEQPTSLRVMWRQRLRWAKGHLLVGLSRFRDVLSRLFTPASSPSAHGKFSVFDLGMNIYPSLLVFLGIGLLQHALLWLSPLFGYSVGEAYARVFPSMLYGGVFYYVMTVLLSALLYVVERRRIPHVRPTVKLLSILLMPVFLTVSFGAAVAALFTKNVSWKPIPHQDTTTIEALGDQKKP